jgi:hypothetical protein
VFEEACRLGGLDPGHCWEGYADDLAIDSTGATAVADVQYMLSELQSACALVGLHLNASKTEILAVNVTLKSITEADAVKERAIVAWDDGSYEGLAY